MIGMRAKSLYRSILKILLIASSLLMIFSIIQIVSADYRMNKQLRQWNEIREQKRSDQILDDLRPDQLINEAPNQQNISHPINQATESNETSTAVLYEHFPEKGDMIGVLTIPAINKELPMIHGTDQKQLAQGVGHFIGSALPGQDYNVILAGHRDTVFRGLGEIEMGEHVHLETEAGLFTYEINDLQIVESDDRSIIISTEEPLLTIITCYPFNYVGSAPQRYILTGKLIDQE